MARQPEIAG